MPMRLKTYKSDLDYSYTLGTIPTTELILKNPKLITEVIYSKEFVTDSNFLQISTLCKKHLIKLTADNYLIKTLAQKENTKVIGVFKKYKMSLQKDKNHILLYKPNDIGNVGMIIRSAVAFNRPNIAIIGSGVDCFNPKVIRATMGAFFNCNVEYFKSLSEYQLNFANKIFAFDINGSTNLKEFEFKGINSYLFGTESSGLPSELLLSLTSIKIEYNSRFVESLNLANSVSIALYRDFI